MQDKIQQFKAHVTEVSANPDFVHHKWFVQWHLEIVERLAMELLEFYPQADRDLVLVLVWLHDYGKILDYDNQYQKTLVAGREKLSELGLPAEFVDTVIGYAETLDKKLELDIAQAPIEVQIVSTADGCSHMVGPFIYIVWNEATDKTFAGKTLAELMEADRKKADKDWNHKIVLPEARKAFEIRYRLLCEQSGELPQRFFEGQ